MSKIKTDRMRLNAALRAGKISDDTKKASERENLAWYKRAWEWIKNAGATKDGHQSHWQSAFEALQNIWFGFAISMVLWLTVVAPLLIWAEIEFDTLLASIIITTIYTIASFLRSYGLRRFNIWWARRKGVEELKELAESRYRAIDDTKLARSSALVAESLRQSVNLNLPKDPIAPEIKPYSTRTFENGVDVSGDSKPPHIYNPDVRERGGL